MRILHIVAGDLSGGAAKGAYRLHISLKEFGVESHIISNSKVLLDDQNITYTSVKRRQRILNFIFRKLESLMLMIYPNRTNRIFSSGCFGFNFTKTSEYKKADLIHLHWINDSFVNIKHLRNVKKPIVWTMRDMWSMTGGCHYSMGCERFKSGCGRCEQLNSGFNIDLSRFVTLRKLKYYPKHIQFVGLSSWLSGQAKNSKILHDFDVTTIHNSVNVNEFFPVKKEYACEALGIDTGKKIVSVGAFNLTDFYKGFDGFLDCLNYLDRDKYFLCFFGHFDEELVKQLGFDYFNFGYMHDIVSLRLIYNCSDVFVAPSKMEAFGKTITEAMSCGTPVVCFDASGPKDIISHKVDGYRAIPFDSTDLALGIEWICQNDDYNSLCNNARSKVLKKFDTEVIANTYHTLYKKLLKMDENCCK